MFYHQGILQKRGGKFGIIWLAATRIEHLKRRELCEVNLQKTCDEIIDHIMVRMHGNAPGKKRTRFSLYLSSQLMYGVTRVLAKQSEFLFGDASTFFTRVRMAFISDAEAEIDLKGIFRCEMVTIPDMANIDSPGRPGFDPNFGLMRMGSSESKITYPELEMWRVNSSMVIPGSPYLSPVPQRRGSSSASKEDSGHMIQPEIGSPHTVSSKEEITIREEEIRIPDIEVPGEKDLPTFDGKELDLILEEPLDPNVNWMSVLSPLRPDQPPKETTLEQVAQDRVTLSPKETTPFTRTDGEIPQRREVTLSPGVTPIPKMAPVQASRMRPSLTMQLTPVTPSPIRRRRRRHLCIDRNTQISKEQLRNNMKTGNDTCLSFVLPDPKNSTVKDLFSRPGKTALTHPSILPLWERNTKYGISETDSDRGIPVWSVPDLHLQEEEPRSRKRLRISTPPAEKVASPPRNIEPDVTVVPAVDPEVTDMPSIEIARDPSISMERSRHADVTPVSLRRSHSLLSDVDKSKDSFTEEPSAKKSRSSGKTRSRGGTSSEDDLVDIATRTISEASFPTREDISITGNLSVVQEEEINISHLQEIPSIVTELQAPTPHRDILIRTLDQLDRQKAPTTFQHICPVQTSSRKMAAKMFATLLDLCAENKLEVEQHRPYDDIYISKGQNW